jgi:hypothetical protein
MSIASVVSASTANLSNPRSEEEYVRFIHVVIQLYDEGRSNHKEVSVRGEAHHGNAQYSRKEILD